MSQAREWSVTRSTVIAADPRAVWERIASPEGIDFELRPWLTMSTPRGTALATDTLPLGEPLGRAWLRLFGVLPDDYDALRLTVLEPGRRFREESTMLSMRPWVHDRTVEPEPGGGTRVTDHLTLVPRAVLASAGPLPRAVVAALFAHRHRRLLRWFD